MRRYRPDDGCPVINRRILVISRSPALSRAIQASLGPGYQVVTSSNVIDVEEEVSEEGPFDVLVAGPVFDSHAGMARLANLRAMSAVPAVVLALGPKPKANLGDIVRTGRGRTRRIPDLQASALQRVAACVRYRRRVPVRLRPARPGRRRRRRGGALALRRGVHGRLIERRLRQDLLRHQPGLLPGRTNRTAGVLWSISTSSSARSRQRCTCGPGSPFRTCSRGSQSMRTTSTNTSRSISRSTSSGSPCWRRPLARPTPT